jgi:membrane-associated phospholipid phosphatase
MTAISSPLSRKPLSWTLLGLSFLICCLISALSWIFWDRPLAEFLHLGRYVRKPSKILTKLGNGGIWVILAVLGLLWSRYWQKSRLYFSKFAAMILAIATSGLVINILKLAIGRSRPRSWFYQDIYTINPFIVKYSKCSFPSGHTQTAFAALISLALIFPKHRWYFVILAFIIGTTRLTLSSHFLSDVLMGAYIGTFMAIICHYYCEKIPVKIVNKSRQ